MKNYIILAIFVFFSACQDSTKMQNEQKNSEVETHLGKLFKRVYIFDTMNISKEIKQYFGKKIHEDSLIFLANIFLTEKFHRPDLARMIFYYYDSIKSSNRSAYYLSQFMEIQGKYDSASYYSYKAFNAKKDLKYLDNAIYYTSYINVHKAFFDINKAIQMYPDYAYFHFRKANILLQLGKYQEAIDLYNYTESRFKLKEVYRNRGMAYNLVKNYEASLIDAEKALNLGDTTFESYLVKADALYYFYNYDSALIYINKSIDLNKNSSAAFFIRCKVYKELGKYDLAMQDLETMHKLDSSELLYYGLKARIYQQTNNYKEAKKYYEMAFLKGEFTGKKFYDEMMKKK